MGAFFSAKRRGANEGIAEKNRRDHEDHVQSLRGDDGSAKNKPLSTRATSTATAAGPEQNEEGSGRRKTATTTPIHERPAPVHCGAQTPGSRNPVGLQPDSTVQRDSFWAASASTSTSDFSISNAPIRSSTRTLRCPSAHQGVKRRPERPEDSNSFEFTSYWADAANRVNPDLGASRDLLRQHTFLAILTRICVFTSRMLLVMRPYQIAATERILNRVEIATNIKIPGR